MGDKTYHGSLFLPLMICFLCNSVPLVKAGYDGNITHVRAVHLLCNRTSNMWVAIRMQPAVDIAHETIQERLKNDIYKNFELNVTNNYQGCEWYTLGSGIDLYVDKPYDAIIGPASSIRTICK